MGIPYPNCTIFLLFAGNLQVGLQFGTNNAGARTPAMGNTSLTLTDAFMLQPITRQRWHLLKVLLLCFSTAVFSVCQNSLHFGVVPYYLAAGCFWFIGSSRWQSDFQENTGWCRYGQNWEKNIAVGVQLDLIHTGSDRSGKRQIRFTAEAVLLQTLRLS